MPSKFQFYSELAEHTVSNLTYSPGKWTQFLDSAAWLYKYPFQDQVMIYAQRPDATACAELEFWNEKFARWVRRGSKGIALIDDSGSYPRLNYIFDVRDTEPMHQQARPVTLWEMRNEHIEPIMRELANNYDDVSSDGTPADTIHNIAKQLADEYYEENKRDIFYRSENSMLEPPANYDFAGTIIEYPDDTALRIAFEDTLANSVAYTIMKRCRLNPDDYFDSEDFQGITDFNTPDMINALGTASSELSEQMLREIEITIRKYERVKNAERSITDHDRNTDLHAGRGLSSSRPEIERTAEGTDSTAGQVREDAEEIPQKPQADSVQPPAADREAVPASEGDGRSGGTEDVADDSNVEGEDGASRQSGIPDGLGGSDGNAESAGGGNSAERVDLQLNTDDAPPEDGSVSISGEATAGTLSQLGKRCNYYIKSIVVI